MSAAPVPPAGYAVLARGATEAVGLSALAEPLRVALQSGTLYAYAGSHPERRSLAGRGVAWAVPLPHATARVVVRRSRHGGLLAPITGEWFAGRTRAPRELALALRLAELGVPTPEVVAWATYRAGPLLRRADVATREVPGARDLAAALSDAATPADRAAPLAATARLLDALAAAGAVHPDLNIKNVLLRPDAEGGLRALVLDVDRVRFTTAPPAHVRARNLSRLLRSLRKWERAHRVAPGTIPVSALAAVAPEAGAPDRGAAPPPPHARR